MTESPPSNYRSRLQTPRSRLIGGLNTPAMTSVMKHAHDTSLVSLAYNFASGMSKRQESYQRFSPSLLKNKSLLVPTRLALKRQRAAMKSPTLQYEPLQCETFQMELGNPEEKLPTPMELNRIQSTSNYTNQLTEDIPQAAPADISLMYREKPAFIHPVSGHFIIQYTEDSGSPSPCSYVLPRKSCREKNAPAYTFGMRCLVEKKGGSRTAWNKQWFAHSNPFTTKVDFNRENSWPTPFHYPARPTIGSQSTKVSFPAYSIATRFTNSPTLMPETNPAPDTYDTTTAFRKLTAKSIPITLKSRTGGTQISINQSTDVTPGPGAHDQSKFFSIKPSSPKHTFGKRIPASLRQDPYISVLPVTRIAH